jgi:oligopeptide/dipeptide ABC transporter ATP-binding protein
VLGDEIDHATGNGPLVEVEGLTIHFPVAETGFFRRQPQFVHAVDDVSFSIAKGETLGLVGESGSGKTTTGRALLRRIDPTAGRIHFRGRDITESTGSELRHLRRHMQLVFQDPYASLNPRMTVGELVAEPLLVHGIINSLQDGRERVTDLLDRCGLPIDAIDRYPHAFSGGQRQRVGIARALALQPDFIVADEPVSALDVSVRAQVVNLLQDLQDEFGIAYVFVAHDLSVVRQMSHRVAVMYLGSIMELTDRDTLYSQPLHPYTHALMSAVPVPDPHVEATRERIVLQGDLPSPINLPEGCVFSTRCFKAQDRCRVETPPLEEYAPGHSVACFFPITESLGPQKIIGPDGGAIDLAAPEVPPPSEVIADMESSASSRPKGADYAGGDGEYTEEDW